MPAMTVRLNKEVEAKLARLAARTGYEKSRLAAAAIAAYVDADAAESEALERAVAEADAGGPFYDHDEVMRYLEARARGTSASPGPCQRSVRRRAGPLAAVGARRSRGHSGLSH